MSEASLSGRRGAKAKGKTQGDKRERILGAAVTVFARAGFHATRVSDIAKAAGVADGTIYLYFKSKEQILISLFEDRVERLLEFLETRLPAEPTASAKLRAIIELQLGLLEGERDLAEVITVIVRQSSALLRKHAVPRFRAYLDAVGAVVALGQRSGEFRRDISPSVVARALFGALDGVALTWALGKAEDGGLSRAAKGVAELFLTGLRTPSPP
jgi:TetR/AcrR family fatty acid metabolism transcriptional regulator